MSAEFRSPGWPAFQSIATAFVNHSTPWHYLEQVHATNKALAETLLIFANELKDPTHDNATRRAYTHYVVNTSDPMLSDEVRLPSGVFAWARDYAAALGIKATETDTGTRLELGDTVIPCDRWTETEGESAAGILRLAGIFVNKCRYGRTDVIPSSLFPFDELATDHYLPNAMQLADLAALVYRDRTFVQQQIELWGFNAQEFAWIESPATDTQAFVAGRHNHLIVSFRGTSSTRDWLTDIRFRKEQAPGGHGSIHRGFKQALDSVWPQLDEAVLRLAGGRGLFMTGHSLGAGLAQLAAYRLAREENLPIRAVYTFGSPLFGDKDFADAYNELLGPQTYHHINHQDVVPRIPPQWLGFRPMGQDRGRFTFDQGHALSRGDGTVDGPPNGTNLDQDGQVIQATQAEQEMVHNELEFRVYAASESIERTTRYLTDPAGGEDVSYAAAFETGPVDDHGISQYLFKLACRIVDDTWESLLAHSDDAP